MARVTVEDCLEQVENRFALIKLGIIRARELRKSNNNDRIFHSKNKESVHALREIAAGYVKLDDTSTVRLRAILGRDETPGV